MNLFLILLILNALFSKRDRLYCGLFGWVGTSVDHFVPLKLKFLGVLNDSRGGDGVGLFNGTETIKSINPDEFGKLITSDEDTKAFVPHTVPVFLGHTRKKSTGLKDLIHTQPILESDETLHTRVFHNGTITELTSLIETAQLSKEIPSIVGLSDTQVLTKMLHIYRKQGTSFKTILENYTGAASLMLSFSDDPEAVYIFRGRMAYSSGALSTERPLYYVREAGKGFYISSLEESLEYISDNSDFEKVKEVPQNTLIRLVGDTEEVVEEFTRIWKSTYVKPNYANNVRGNIYGRDIDDYDEYGISKSLVSTKLKFTEVFDFKNLTTLAQKKSKDWDMVTALDFISEAYTETSIVNKYFHRPSSSEVGSGRVMYYKGRYLLCYAKGTGGVRTVLANSTLLLDSDGYIVYPTHVNATTYRFRHGVLLKSDISESEVLEAEKNDSINEFSMSKNIWESIEYFLEYSSEPVVLYNRINSPLYTLDKDGRLTTFDGKYRPLFLKKEYTIRNGIVTYMDHIVYSTPANKALNTAITTYVPPKKDGVYVTKKSLSGMLVRCPSCLSDSLVCKTCRGEGYVMSHIAENFHKTTTTNNVMELPFKLEEENENDRRETSSFKAFKNYADCTIEGCDNEDMINEEVLEKIKLLSDTLSAISNDLTIIGDSTPLLEKYKILLEDTQDNLSGLVYA